MNSWFQIQLSFKFQTVPILEIFFLTINIEPVLYRLTDFTFTYECIFKNTNKVSSNNFSLHRFLNRTWLLKLNKCLQTWPILSKHSSHSSHFLYKNLKTTLTFFVPNLPSHKNVWEMEREKEQNKHVSMKTSLAFRRHEVSFRWKKGRIVIRIKTVAGVKYVSDCEFFTFTNAINITRSAAAARAETSLTARHEEWR